MQRRQHAHHCVAGTHRRASEKIEEQVFDLAHLLAVLERITVEQQQGPAVSGRLLGLRKFLHAVKVAHLDAIAQSAKHMCHRQSYLSVNIEMGHEKTGSEVHRVGRKCVRSMRPVSSLDIKRFYGWVGFFSSSHCARYVQAKGG